MNVDILETTPVSYTHLDVYKRQVYCQAFIIFYVLKNKGGLKVGYRSWRLYRMPIHIQH